MRSFPAIRIEGGLFAPDLLEQLLAEDLPGQKPRDFGLDGRRNLTDEIAAVFADAQDLWNRFQHRLEQIPESDPGTSVTRDAWVIPFLRLLGFELQYNRRAYLEGGLTFAISHRAGPDDYAPPVHIVGVGQELGRVAPHGRPRLAPHSLLQEFLNRTDALWGLVTNGLTLRLLRDSTYIRRQCYVEFDLRAILDQRLFPDFAALYRLLHRTRFPRDAADAHQCLLEQYHRHSVEQGGRVRDRLRDGVEHCLTLLANGFLRHPANAELRRRLVADHPNPAPPAHPDTAPSASPPGSGSPAIQPADLYRELLRLVYRFLFLFVSEDRGLISSHPLYLEHYSAGRLRRLVDSRAAHTGDTDLWHSLRLLWKLLADDQPVPQLDGRPLAALLGLPVLNGDLFQPLFLDSCRIANRDLLEALWHLVNYQDSPASPPRRVNYAALDVEELGSVYESLLDFHPAIETDAAGRPAFRLLFGSERKTTGSYYTPPQLVNELITSALEPVIRQRLDAASPQRDHPALLERALLSIRVCDPACGSGHFLLATARRLGKELARIRTGEQEPAPERVREATRDVIAHCIYGVDKNPLAVDLCRVALWLESHTPGKPLTFLDHRIRCGDSLVGVFDLRVLRQGIPDKAFTPLEGDDQAAARAARKRNREERDGDASQLLLNLDPEKTLADFAHATGDLDAIPDDSPELIHRKKAAYEAAHRDPAWRRQKQACDLWTAAFFQRFVAHPASLEAPAITSGVIAEHLAGRPVDARLLGQALAIAARERFFHWPLEFPEVFADGGFDVVLSNPPWERIKLQEQEFFAARDARIATAPTKAARARLIRALPKENPALHDAYVEALRSAGGASQFLRHSGRYPLTGRGDINTYAVFAELARNAVRPGGRAGIIVPSGIATDDTTKFFFQDIARTGALASLYDFENRRRIFPAIDSRLKFCLLTLRGPGARSAEPAEFLFFALATEDLRRPEKRFTLTAGEIALLNPNTGNCPIFRTRADAELTKAIYRRVPVLWQEAADDRPESNPWRLSFNRLFDMANDSHHFRTAAELEADGYRREGNVFVSRLDRYLPLYEAKMLHQFDHRWATYEEAGDGKVETRDVTDAEKADPHFVVQPRYWVREHVVESAIPQFPEPLAAALRLDDPDGLRFVFALWVAGHVLESGDKAGADRLLGAAQMTPAEREVTRALRGDSLPEQARRLAADYPLDAADFARVTLAAERALDPAEATALARELVERFSPKWFLGWRDITNSTNERTTIAAALPIAAVGDTFLLMFTREPSRAKRLGLLAALNTFVQDYAARQKVGGTHMKYNVFKQIPVPTPALLDRSLDLISSRALELTYTAHDLTPLARDCGYEGPPFGWDPERRFELRCELDAAFFHLYLPSDERGGWRPARREDGCPCDETPEQLAALKAHFPRPRDAVAYILDQFPIVRQKDEAAHGHYRTKDRILHYYDTLLQRQPPP